MCNWYKIEADCALRYLPNEYIINRNLKWGDTVKYQLEDKSWTPWLTFFQLTKLKDRLIKGPQIVRIFIR